MTDKRLTDDELKAVRDYVGEWDDLWPEYGSLLLSNIDALLAERDALAAKLARVQAVVDRLPDRWRTPSTHLNDKAVVLHAERRAIREQLDAALQDDTP